MRKFYFNFPSWLRDGLVTVKFNSHVWLDVTFCPFGRFTVIGFVVFCFAVTGASVIR